MIFGWLKIVLVLIYIFVIKGNKPSHEFRKTQRYVSLKGRIMSRKDDIEALISRAEKTFPKIKDEINYICALISIYTL